MMVSVKYSRQLEMLAEFLYKTMLIFYLVLFGLLFTKAATADGAAGSQLAYANEVTPPSVNHLDSAIAQVELNTLLDRLVSSYEDGNIEAFISLFDSNVVTEDVDSREILKKQYDELFSMTSSRLFLLHGIEWGKSGSKAAGEGEFQVKVKASNGKYIKSVHGRFRIEAVKQQGKVHITRFVYLPS